MGRLLSLYSPMNYKPSGVITNCSVLIGDRDLSGKVPQLAAQIKPPNMSQLKFKTKSENNVTQEMLFFTSTCCTLRHAYEESNAGKRNRGSL